MSPPVRHIDCLGKHSEATKNTFEWTLLSLNEIDAKPMKSRLYSRQYTTPVMFQLILIL